MTVQSISQTTRDLIALSVDDDESDAQPNRVDQLTDPENQDDFQLAALRLVEQNKIATQSNGTLLPDENYEVFEDVTEGQFLDWSKSNDKRWILVLYWYNT